MQLTRKDIALLAATGGLSAVVLVVANAVLGRNFYAAFLGLVLAFIAAVQIITLRKMKLLLQAESVNVVRQVQALLSLHAALGLKQPLPALGGWAITPQDATVILSLIKEYRPRRVLELGSGSSSLIVGHALKAIGQGKSIALEHDERYSRISQENVRNHQLQDVVEIVHAPLINLKLNKGTWKWYDVSHIPHIENIDLLIVDGPPGHIQNLSRYPALPMLIDKLSDEAVIFLDDAGRPDEKKIVAIWLKEHLNAGLSIDESSDEGYVILRKHSSNKSQTAHEALVNSLAL